MISVPPQSFLTVAGRTRSKLIKLFHAMITASYSAEAKELVKVNETLIRQDESFLGSKSGILETRRQQLAHKGTLVVKHFHMHRFEVIELSHDLYNFQCFSQAPRVSKKTPRAVCRLGNEQPRIVTAVPKTARTRSKRPHLVF